METTRSISNITVNFFKTLDVHASKLTEIVEEAQAVNEQKLSELEKKFEVVAVLHNKFLLCLLLFKCLVLSYLHVIS